jgi:hypothetical protein
VPGAWATLIQGSNTQHVAAHESQARMLIQWLSLIAMDLQLNATVGTPWKVKQNPHNAVDPCQADCLSMHVTRDQGLAAKEMVLAFFTEVEVINKNMQPAEVQSFIMTNITRCRRAPQQPTQTPVTAWQSIVGDQSCVPPPAADLSQALGSGSIMCHRTPSASSEQTTQIPGQCAAASTGNLTTPLLRFCGV